jgi:CxxC motif-containing protein (DUF1111 family)
MNRASKTQWTKAGRAIRVERAVMRITRRLSWECAMRARESTARPFRVWPKLFSRIGAVIAVGVFAIGFAWAVDERPSHDVLESGADLFAREWLPRDANGAAGDGLGPVYNETSCVACHHQGGPGGAGPTSTNVEILSAGARTRTKGQTEAEFHPGFRTSRSVVLHRFGVDPMYKAWRLRLMGNDDIADMVESVETEIKQVQELVQPGSSRFAIPRGPALRNGMLLSQRNAPALFGVGLIDSLPDDALLAGEKQQFADFPEVRGRANHRKEGPVGRFGWKAETASLREFVLSACANELGLEVPDHHQSANPLDPDAKAKGLDLTQKECDALVAYVTHLPVPSGRRSVGSQEAATVAEGRSLFESAGCATCHRPRIGEIDGIYSDLLLHDMGPALSDSGSYYGISRPNSTVDGVKMQEWRTPPLWGFRDSGPYLHDGRAKNLEEAVAFHDGQAANSARRFFKFLPEQRLRVQAFLRSLTPAAVAAR